MTGLVPMTQDDVARFAAPAGELPLDRDTRVVMDLEVTAPPLHANQRLHWAARHRITKELREQAGWMAKAAKLGRHDHITVSLAWRPATRGRRDGGENVAPMLKPLIDGLVDAGVVADDTPDQVTRHMPVVLEFAGRAQAGMWLIVQPGPARVAVW